MREINRWRVVLSRHIKHLADFSGQRATERRLKILTDSGYVERKHVLYGVPSLYSLTNAGKKLINVSMKPNKYKIEQIIHDISVLDTAIYFIKKYDVKLAEIQTEKQLHENDGFSNRKHRPDFIFFKGNKSVCVEIELNLKAKDRFDKNIKDNFLTYDSQLWIIPDTKEKIKKALAENSKIYPIKTLILEEIQSYVKSI